MAVEDNNVAGEGGQTQVDQHENKFTETELRAAQQGWVPESEWDGDPEQWRPAKEFLDRGELFKKIDEQNRTIKEFRRTLDEFSKHHARVRETEYKRAREDLLRQKKEALQEGDADAVIDIDEKLDMVKEAQRAATVPQVAEPVINPTFAEWKSRNDWYDTNEAMRAYADRIGNTLGAQGGMSVTDILSEVEKRVKKEFASKFVNPKRNAPGAVEGGSKPASGGKKETYEMTPQERRAMERFVKQGVITEEQYIADLKAYKEKTR